MAIQISGQIPEAWERAMARATADHLHALKLNERTYAVRSTKTAPGTHHVITLDESGKISGCDCPGWRGRQHPCKHSAAVAKRLMREQGYRKPATEPTVIVATSTRSQVFISEEAA